MGNRTLKNQHGSIVLYVIAGVAAVSVMAVIGTTVLTNILSGGQRSNLTITTGQILTQAAYTLTTETNTAGSYPVAPAFLVATPNPTNGGQIPTTSAAPKVDAWGTAIGYCTNTAASQGDPVFAVVSAGADKTFQTTCAQALVGTVAGDDGVRAKNVTNIKQGVGGTVYWGDPVASLATLESLTVARAGELRSTKDTGSLYINKTGTPGQGYWSLIGGVSAVAAAVPNPPVVTPTGGGGITPVIPTLPTIPSLVPSIPSAGGTLWANGDNTYGQLGVGDTVAHSGDIQVGTGANWGEIFTSVLHTSFGIKSDGTLWAWGMNSDYLLGLPSVALNSSIATPTQVISSDGVDNKWTKISAGSFVTAGVRSDGTLWTWGSGQYSTLGNGGSNVTSPAKIGTDTNWSFVSCGWVHCLAIKTNGTLWAWGNNGWGALGTGSSSTSPMQVGIAFDWVSVQAGHNVSVGLKSNGTVWAWGDNGNGAVGTGTAGGNITTPTQVGVATDWAYISSKYDTIHAIKTNGELWGWGSNTFKALGLSPKVSANPTPTLIDVGPWATINTGQVVSVAVKTDGSVWNWGWWTSLTPSSTGTTGASNKMASGYQYRLMIKP